MLEHSAMYHWQIASYSNSTDVIHFSWQSGLKPFFQLRTALFSNDGGWGWYAGGTSWLPSVKALPFSQTCLYYRFDITILGGVVVCKTIARQQTT